MVNIRMDDSKRETLEQLVEDLKGIPNLVAIMLGGSHCTGYATTESDIDIGLYYEEKTPFDIAEIRKIAGKYQREGEPTVTDFYAWGAWVNGGAWLATGSGEVDMLYRNVGQVRATIEDGKQGKWKNDYEQQPPYGFSSMIYFAETFYGVPLYDPYQLISGLKAEVQEFPAQLKAALVQQCLWSANFSIWQAGKYVQKADVYNTAGCFTRAVKNIVEVVFALNEKYSIGDKYALRAIGDLPCTPSGFEQRINAVLLLNRDGLNVNLNELRELFNDVVKTAGSMYRPYFEL